MANPSKAKGTSAETRVVNWLRDNGFPEAHRSTLTGSKDQGDIRLSSSLPVIGEVKWRRATPTAAQIDEWVQQTVIEALNAGVEIGFLLYNRPGSANVDTWTALIPVTSPGGQPAELKLTGAALIRELKHTFEVAP